ncbi:hypothetical protein YIM_28775 [Amycolatopsis sp. YIM 10]|nr:hypothetical protein YIM_28775 [Amycolatopsis sp. YIM 10]
MWLAPYRTMVPCSIAESVTAGVSNSVVPSVTDLSGPLR